MKKYKEISLDQEARDYIKEILAHGHTLANLLLQNTDLSSGRIITYLPEYVSEESIQKFEEGGKIKINEKKILNISLQDEAHLKKSGLTKNLNNVTEFVGQFDKTSNVRVSPVPNTDFWLTSIIMNFIKTKNKSMCVFENTLAKPSDPWLMKRKTKILTFNNSVYHFINSENTSEKEIQNTIREASATYPPLIGIMTTVDAKAHKLNDGDKIDLELLKLIVQGTKKIIIGAYDGEGYLIWGKTN